MKLQKLEERFLITSAQQREGPLRSLEERMLKYQKEVDASAKREIRQEVIRQSDLQKDI